MSILQHRNFDQNAEISRIRQHQKSLYAERQQNEETQRRIVQQRRELEFSFARERAALLEERTRFKRALPTTEREPQENVARNNMRLAILPNDRRKSVEQNRVTRMQQLTAANMINDERKRQKTILQARMATRSRILDRIRKSLGKEVQISDEQLMKHYENGTLQRLQMKYRGEHRPSPSNATICRRQCGDFTEVWRRSVSSITSTTTDAVGKQPDASTGASTSGEETETTNVVIQFDGTDYELVGVPRVKGGREIEIDANKDETNVVYYNYKGDEQHQSAVRLPPPMRWRRPSIRRLQKPPIRLTSMNSNTEDPRASGLDDTRDSGMSSIGETEAGECKDAIEFIRLLNSAGFE